MLILLYLCKCTYTLWNRWVTLNEHCNVKVQRSNSNNKAIYKVNTFYILFCFEHDVFRYRTLIRNSLIEIQTKLYNHYTTEDFYLSCLNNQQNSSFKICSRGKVLNVWQCKKYLSIILLSLHQLHYIFILVNQHNKSFIGEIILLTNQLTYTKP